VIDLSELRFLDLVGLRALLRGVESDVAGTARLVGATGIVRRLIDLADTLDGESADTAQAPFPAEPSTRVSAEHHDSVTASAIHAASENGAGRSAAVASSPPDGQPQ